MTPAPACLRVFALLTTALTVALCVAAPPAGAADQAYEQTQTEDAGAQKPGLREQFSNSSSSAQWYRTYSDAKKAVANALKTNAREDWQRAEKLLLQATAEAAKARVKPGVIQGQGLFIEHFVPDYYLGIVYEATGEPQKAADAYTRAEAVGATTRQREFRDIDTRKNRLALSLAGAGGKAPSTASKVPPVTVAPRVTESPDFTGKGDGLPSDVTSGGDGRTPDPGLPPGLKARIEVQLVEVPNLLGLSVSQARQAITKARLRANVRSVESKQRPNTVVMQAPQANTRVRPGSVIDVAYSAPEPGPDPEQVAVRAYFAGDYGAAIRTIDALVSRKLATAASSRVHFYLACSYAAQSILLPGESDRLLTAARAAYERAATDPRRFARDRTYISPRVLRLLEPPAYEAY